MRAYYGSRFSPNMTATPEGFLVAHNVPIARTGWYEYMGEEIGANDQTGKVVRVYRSPEEVFSPGSMASFEGKILTDEHPSGLVTPDNASLYTKGVVQNVRQGSGADSDLLLADLVVHDQSLINEIQDGKREVSCGYDCVYEPMDDGTYQQKQICGNHVAVVENGRAGDRVAIHDSKTQKTEGETRMAKKITIPKKQSRVTDILAALGLKHFATDAEPEEIMDAVNAMAEEKGPIDEENKEDDKKDPVVKDADPATQALEAKVDKLTELVTQLLAAEKAEQQAKPEDAIDDAIAELEKPNPAEDDDNEEESHTIPAEQMDDEGPVSPAEERPKSAMTGDNAYKIAALKAIKPIIAAIPDPVQRKAAADAAIASIKAKPRENTYAAMNKRKKATDNKPTAGKPQDFGQLGREIAKKYNPHYKDRA
jgi:hypothetical protein